MQQHGCECFGHFTRLRVDSTTYEQLVTAALRRLHVGRPAGSQDHGESENDEGSNTDLDPTELLTLPEVMLEELDDDGLRAYERLSEKFEQELQEISASHDSAITI